MWPCRRGVKIYGTNPERIDDAEDRSKFSAILDEIGVNQAPWRSLVSIEDALDFSATVGYPCLVRPSYILSGSAMNVAYTPEELTGFLKQAVEVSSEYPVVITKFVEGNFLARKWKNSFFPTDARLFVRRCK